MKKGYLKTLALATAAAPLMLVSAANAGEYLPGDFHQHSLYTDGGHPFSEMMTQNNNYLQWWANSEHGGERNRDGNGEKWDDPTVYPVNPILGDVEMSGGHQEMWRWQSLRDYVYPDIEEARAQYPDKIIISGLEQNVPGHEHCSTAVYQYDGTATAISEFEYRFDRSDDDTSRNGEPGLLEGFGTLGKTNDDKEDAISGVQWMQALKDQGVGDAWVVPAHVERKWTYVIEDFRNWMDAGPDVAIGFEGQPGHQTSSDRGFSRRSLGGGTYGGTGFYAAKVGGLWDALSAEGRKFFNFASSDDHWHWSMGGSDFWPGEYQKIYTYIDTNAEDKIQAVFDGNRSGNSWNVQGDLIDKLIFTVENAAGEEAMMGETLKVAPGEQVTVKILMRDPKWPNNSPFAFDNPSLAQIGISQPLNMPVLDHVDMITGTITGNVPATDMNDPVATDYGTDTAVTATFNNSNWKANKNGVIQVKYTLNADDSMFLRLRGTNLPANVPFETDQEGNPLADTEANDNIYAAMYADELAEQLIDGVEITTNSKLDEVAEAYADLWFYSNPIYIEVQ
ncbi:hypothetical protein [Candidatus Electrothrix sp.]|uniref:hypothetical protein n=1 Tax=Candidatus Electrothrix sp. TaxID=2170559 RepID=UPI004057CB4A